MPQVKTEARDGIVYFLDGVGTSETTYTYPNPQSEFTLQNTGTRRLIWSVGPYTDILVSPGETVTRQMEENTSSFKIRAEYHYQSFSMSSREVSVTVPTLTGLKEEVNGINSKMAQETTTFYVSTTGSDTNDGKTANSAFATLQKAIDTVANAYLVIQSTIKIDIQPGSYNQASSVPTKLQSKERIQFVGKKDANGIPTVIFDGTGLNGSGIFANEKAFFAVFDIKFQNYRNAGSTACGVHAQHFANVWTSNVHITNCDWGISVSANSRLYVQGGIVDNCRFGIRHYSNCVGTIGYNAGSLALGTVIKNCTQAGVYFQNQSSGHVDYCTVDGNVAGITCVNQSRAHVMGCDIKNNTQNGVHIYHQSTWMNDNNTFTNNAKKWSMTAFSTELNSHMNSKSVLSTHMDTDQLVHTGTLTLTSLKSAPAIAANTFVDKGRKVKIIARGTFAGPGIKTVQIRLSPAGIVQSPSSQSGASGSWRLEVEMYANSSSSQKTHMVWVEGGASSSVAKSAYLAKAYDFTVSQTIGLYGQLEDATASIIVETFEIEEVI